MMTERNKSRVITNAQVPTELDVLLEAYRQSRSEGLQLTHSLFRDFTILITFSLAVLGGGLLTQERQFLLILPLLLGAFGLYGISKFRTNSLITSHMIYLENRINQLLQKPVLIWNSFLVSKHISARRKSKWGFFAITSAFIVTTTIYGAICAWIWYVNDLGVSTNSVIRLVYVLVVVVPYVVNVASLVEALRGVKRYGPEYICTIVNQQEGRFRGETKTTANS